MTREIAKLHLSALPHTGSSRRGVEYLAALYKLVGRLGFVKGSRRDAKVDPEEKIITKWWRVIVVVLLFAVFVFGYQEMYFHQDDLDWFIMVNRPIAKVMSAPIGDHVNYVWRALLKTEWELFGFNYAPYLAVSILLHATIVWLIYRLAQETSGRADLAAYAALLFTINTNWTETVLWISGQTITITALFVLLTMLAIWRKKGEGILLVLASSTSALAIGLVLASLMVFGKLRKWGVAILVTLGLVYKFLATDSTALEVSLGWMVKVAELAGLMMINSAVGRLLIPFDRFEMVRIGIVTGLIGYGLWRWRDKLSEIWRDAWSRFLIGQIVFYNLIVSVGRSQYGVGIMRAERYVYLELALLLLLAVRVLKNWKVGRWGVIIPIIVMLQIGGLWVRANYYTERPQQLKKLVQEMRREGRENYDSSSFLPHFVLNDEQLKYGELIELLKH